jgi:hypothetical protein
MFGALKYGVIFLLYWTPVTPDQSAGGDGSASFDYESCYQAYYYGCRSSEYQELGQFENYARRANNVEDVVEYVAQIDLRAVCSELVDLQQCRQERIDAAPAHCEDRFRRERERIANYTEFLNYVCVEHLDELEANQQCFADYDLLVEVYCCVTKTLYSNNCSVERMSTCAQHKIRASSSCTSDSVEFYLGVVEKAKATLLRDDVEHICPRRRGPRTTGSTMTLLQDYRKLF